MKYFEPNLSMTINYKQKQNYKFPTKGITRTNTIQEEPRDVIGVEQI